MAASSSRAYAFVLLLQVTILGCFAQQTGPAGVVFHDIAKTDPVLSTYVHPGVPAHMATVAALVNSSQHNPPFPIAFPRLATPELVAYPIMPPGLPGIGIGKLVGTYTGAGATKANHIYVTNNEGSPNMLFKNLIDETGVLQFEEVGATAGLDLVGHESAGTCYGDTDNDGDEDIVVLDLFGQNHRFFENQGDGTFVDKTTQANIVSTATVYSSSSCAFGDVNGDGLLDLYVGNSIILNNFTQCGVVGTASTNSLFINQGGNVFADESAERGVGNFQAPTWAVAVFDYNKNGALDIFSFDDQCAFQGFPRGYIRVYINNGTGYFTDQTGVVVELNQGAWMGVSVADFNGDERIDFFGGNFGAYVSRAVTPPQFPSSPQASEWYLQSPNGTFYRPGLGAMGTSVFSWGTSTFDSNNNGKWDIVYTGGLDMPGIWDASNPLAFLVNTGDAIFERDAVAFSSTNHQRRGIHPLAVGDLDNDGFVDVAQTSTFEFNNPAAFIVKFPLGGVFDTDPGSGVVFNIQNFFQNNTARYLDIPREPGRLSVEINSADSGNKWIKIEAIGAAGVIAGAKTPRDGIGAIITVRTSGIPSQTVPVLGGSSHCSQDALEKIFGLGDAHVADVEIFWPGGATNYVQNVVAFGNYVIPALTCDVKGDDSFPVFHACVTYELNKHVAAGAINPAWSGRLLAGNIHGYFLYH